MPQEYRYERSQVRDDLTWAQQQQAMGQPADTQTYLRLTATPATLPGLGG